ncbi:MAG: polyprenyl synthetase family protein [Pseudomonadota bacterium]|nr:polyprenyl synthetase family protein [Pseudomonadota bacterium]
MNLSEINRILRNELSDLEKEMTKRSKTSVLLINELSEHIIKSGGKRLRPIILMLSSKMTSIDDSPDMIKAAVILEFIHAATLLHDDVVDMSEIRHSQDTANTIWGNKGAVLVGDFLYSRAFEMIVEIDNPKIYQILAHTTNTIAQGEVMQLMNIENVDISEASYMEIIYRKTAILFEAAAKIGGVLSSTNSSSEENLGAYGKCFGIAYQLRNDYLDYFGDSLLTGKNIAEDLIEGKVTLPLIHSLRVSDSIERSIIVEKIHNPKSDNLSEINTILKKNESDKYLEDLIDEFSNRAIDYLDAYKTNDNYKALISLTEMCKDRSK